MAVVLIAVGVVAVERRSGDDTRKQQTIDFLRSYNKHEPTQDQIDATLKFRDQTCGNSDTELRFFAALSTDKGLDKSFAVSVLDIWCPDTAARLRAISP